MIEKIFTPANADSELTHRTCVQKLDTELISHAKCKIQRMIGNGHTLLKQQIQSLNKIHPFPQEKKKKSILNRGSLQFFKVR